MTCERFLFDHLKKRIQLQYEQLYAGLDIVDSQIL